MVPRLNVSLGSYGIPQLMVTRACPRREGKGKVEDSRNQTIHCNLLGLSNTVRSIHRLRVIRRIPIVVI